ncbi:beta-galactosidase [Paenibacillus sp. UNC451MF]|uniref:beta-galactosidase n=1 Tax=Paenibacillus sp. UNC451MF TaxID=1449063 RepID=UPI000490C1C9|nr:beta-galactosidase [Paenibacillus sp. UNC451MF]
MINSKLPKIFYGGDYNPDQWPREIWDEDMRLFKLAGIDVATVAVFSWALLQPDEVTYDFTWLDEILDKMAQNGVYACLATSTAAVPAWMAKRYPDVLRVTSDGKQRKFGGRHNFCPSSPSYRRFSRLMARKMAERYGNHPALAVWHVNNEYGGSCYCNQCEKAFRVWLKKRYGTLDAVNKAWNTRFWGHTFHDWDEIVLPSALTEQLGDGKTTFQGISLDYNRFNSDALLECYQAEYEELKAVTPHIKVTTNLMGTFKPLDYFKWAKSMDIVSWDNYPRYDTPVSVTAMRHDLMRGLKDGEPFMLMEQTPSQQNWQAYNSLKRPGVMRLWSYQAVARGADTVMFFQLRRSMGACEKYHGAVIEHVGHEHTRVFRECAQLGDELQRLGDTLLDSRLDSKVAILFDWDNWWAVEMSSGPSKELKYVDEMMKYYKALFDHNIQVDLIGEDTPLDSYQIVIAPLLYMVKPGFAKKLEYYVQQGGRFVTTFFSGIVNENDLVTLGGYPGELRSLLGIWAEEIDALPPEASNDMVMTTSFGELDAGSTYGCRLLCDLIHSEGAEVLAEYGSDFYQGMPVLTRNRFGQGEAWYVATSPNAEFMDRLLLSICRDSGIEPLLHAPEGIEVTRRTKQGQQFTFVLNHNDHPAAVDLGEVMYKDLLDGNNRSGVTELPAKGVWILQDEVR